MTLVVAVVSLAGCAGSTSAEDGAEASAVPAPAAAERVACERVQALVDAVVSGEAVSAMSGLTELESALADSENSTLETNGREFFETISGTVPDPGSLTVDETASVGDRALAAAQPKLQALLDECARLGLTIQNLPTGAGRP
jgi:hypothetical protein